MNISTPSKPEVKLCNVCSSLIKNESELIKTLEELKSLVELQSEGNRHYLIVYLTSIIGNDDNKILINDKTY